MLRFLTGGESHGKCLVTIVEGMPSGLKLNIDDINVDLQRRQKGYGRGDRMLIEKDSAEILSGVRDGVTIGSPITILINNKDWENWKDKKVPPITTPRPGHADLSGVIKYNYEDVRNVLERASARETAVRVAAGAVAKKLLKEFNIVVAGYVVEIGGIKTDLKNMTIKDLARIENSLLRCADKKAEERMIKRIDLIKKRKDTIGGIFEIKVINVPVGLGSFMQWDRRLDTRLAGAVMSIPGIKGVEIGLGFRGASLSGSKYHDEIFYKAKEFFRKTNNAGGIEGGISNGEDIILRAVMKSISTLYKPLNSIDIITKKKAKATVERSDICAVPSACVVAEAVASVEIASLFLEKFGGDSLNEVKRNYNSYVKYVKNF
ncbi:MAG: chorismate synthase [Candidatus Firestonebacteria bacterium]